MEAANNFAYAKPLRTATRKDVMIVAGELTALLGVEFQCMFPVVMYGGKTLWKGEYVLVVNDEKGNRQLEYIKGILKNAPFYAHTTKNGSAVFAYTGPHVAWYVLGHVILELCLNVLHLCVVAYYTEKWIDEAPSGGHMVAKLLIPKHHQEIDVNAEVDIHACVTLLKKTTTGVVHEDDTEERTILTISITTDVMKTLFEHRESKRADLVKLCDLERTQDDLIALINNERNPSDFLEAKDVHDS